MYYLAIISFIILLNLDNADVFYYSIYWRLIAKTMVREILANVLCSVVILLFYFLNSFELHNFWYASHS